MIGHDHAIDPVLDGQARLVRMQYAFEQQWPAPDATQPVEVLPVERRVQHARDVRRE
jgi:hypothetical protein